MDVLLICNTANNNLSQIFAQAVVIPRAAVSAAGAGDYPMPCDSRGPAVLAQCNGPGAHKSC
eukprot:7703402-Pyramimonas_sp.AAC.1